jgi:hypothetical protein
MRPCGNTAQNRHNKDALVLTLAGHWLSPAPILYITPAFSGRWQRLTLSSVGTLGPEPPLWFGCKPSTRAVDETKPFPIQVVNDA